MAFLTHVHRLKRARYLERGAVVAFFFWAVTFSIAQNSPAQELPVAQDSGSSSSPTLGNTIPSATTTTSVQRTSGSSQANTQPSLTTAVVEFYDPATIAGVAPTAGTSGTSRAFEPVLSYAETIGRQVNPNAFNPSDSISDSAVVILPSVRSSGWWDISASAVTAINYDSNIARTTTAGQRFADFYEHESAGANFRLGNSSSPLELHLAYNYTADLFDRYSDFDTYTHNVDFQARIGRSNFVAVPYFIGSFRSVQSPLAISAGRESYDYLEEGVRGNDTFSPDLVHVYDFSHTSVDYLQRVGDNFQIWNLDQELDYRPQARTRGDVPELIQNLTVFPWLDLKETDPDNFASTSEISGGMGGSFEIDREVSVRGRVGWGGVDSSDPTISHGQYSGWRYDASIDYIPIQAFHLRVAYDRILSFVPTTVGRSVDVLDVLLESPLALGSHFTLTPAVEFYYSLSQDYLDNENAFFPQPSLQLNYSITPHVSVFAQAQYRDTDDTRFGFQTDIKVLQTSVGVTATF